jgi:hypothetical protein
MNFLFYFNFRYKLNDFDMKQIIFSCFQILTIRPFWLPFFTLVLDFGIFQSLEFRVTKQSSSSVTKRAGWLKVEFIKRLFRLYRIFLVYIGN